MKPKVLFTLHLPPPIHGAAMMGKFIQESSLVNDFLDATYINLSTSNKISEVGKGGFYKAFSIIPILVKVSKALLTQNYDLCYMTLTAQGFGYYKDFIVVIILKLFRKKIVYHFHNKGVAIQRNKIPYNFLYKITFKATKSILLSSLLYNDISYYVKREKVFFCPNGIPSVVSNIERKKKNNQLDKCNLLFLSNMVLEKGVLVLLEACKILKENGVLFECHFVGAWADVSEEIFNLHVSNYDLSNYIFAHGKKYDQEKLDFYYSADIFVFPTFYHNECFPLVLLEAMQFSLPLISTNEGGIPDIISDGNTGFIVQKNNSVELAHKLEVLVKNEELRSQMGAAGRKLFEDKFTLNHFEYNFLEIIKSAMLN